MDGKVWRATPLRVSSPEARKASVNDLLALAARTNPDDPRGMTQRAVATALFDPYPGTCTTGHPEQFAGGR